MAKGRCQHTHGRQVLRHHRSPRCSGVRPPLPHLGQVTSPKPCSEALLSGTGAASPVDSVRGTAKVLGAEQDAPGSHSTCVQPRTALSAASPAMTALATQVRGRTCNAQTRCRSSYSCRCPAALQLARSWPALCSMPTIGKYTGMQTRHTHFAAWARHAPLIFTRRAGLHDILSERSRKLIKSVTSQSFSTSAPALTLWPPSGGFFPNSACVDTRHCLFESMWRPCFCALD